VGVDIQTEYAQLYVMLTERQREILAYIEAQDPPPTVREIASHFQNSIGTIAQHLRSLRQRGFLAPGEHQARGLKPANSFREHQSPVAHIPLYGTIPAGIADERHQQAEGCISLDIKTIGIKSSQQTFALRVRGDSMIEKHILDGDFAILDQGKTARCGDVVAALIDNESTLKVFVTERGKTFLRAANPKYNDLIPAAELVIQGVLVGLVRGAR
jgi:repressor LexA